MVKNSLKKHHSEKACFGTKEWSRNSGICRKCNYKEDCGKVKEKRGL